MKYMGPVAQEDVNVLGPYMSSDGNTGRVIAEELLRDIDFRTAWSKKKAGGSLTASDKAVLGPAADITGG